LNNTNKKVTISLDCMGGDNAPDCVIEGASIIVKENDNVQFLLYGNERKIERILHKHLKLKNVSEVRHTDEFITNEEKPLNALRRGRNSSMWLAIESVKHGEADAVISAGNTGALMAISKIILHSLPSIDRPALIQLMPNQAGTATALLDMGANLECDSLNLCQFAVMGSAFYSAVMKAKAPTIGLLNIGSEDMKGNDSIKNASNMLKESNLRDLFYGFIEGDDILKGVVDVIVADGFSGNIALKAIEGASKFVRTVVKQGFEASLMAKIGYCFAKRSLNEVQKIIDPNLYNGAMLVGFKRYICKKSW
jgi:phosphate acyltransferase